MAAILKVVLLKRDGVYRAQPGFVVAEPGDKIRFLNFSDAAIELTFPNGPYASGSTIVVGGGWDATVPASAEAGPHAYVGTINGSPSLQGGSSPEIIVDRFGISQY